MAVSRRLRFEILRRDGHTCRYCGASAPDVEMTVDHVIPVTLGGSDDPSNLVTACKHCNAGKSSIPADAALVDDVAADAIRWRRALDRARLELAAERELIDDLLDRFEDAWLGWGYDVEVTVPPEPLPLTGDPLVDNWHRFMGYDGLHSEPVGVDGGTLIVRAERGYTSEVRRTARQARDEWAQALGVPDLEVIVEPGGTVSPPPRPPQPTKRTERRTIPLDDNWRETVERFLSLSLDIDEQIRLIGVAMRRQNVAHHERFRYFCGCAWRTITDLQESARRILEEEERG